MTILTGNLRRIFKKKLRIFVIAILPAIILLLTSTSIIANSQLNMGIIDLDKTDYTTMLTNHLALQTKIKEITQDQIQNELINSKVDYVVVMEKGFTAGLLKGEDVEAKGYYLKDSIRSLPVQNYLAGYLSSAKKIAKASGGDEQRFYEGLKMSNADLQLEYKVLTGFDRQKTYFTLGVFLEIILMTTVMFTTLILTDKGNKTFYRTLTAPVSLRSYMFQNILSFLLVSVIQVTIVFIVLKGLIGTYMGNSILIMYLLFLAASVLTVSIGVAVSSFSKSVIQASFAGMFITFSMGTIGGCLWEHDMATNLLNTIGKFTPVYWIMDGVSKLLKEQGLFAISGDILIVFLFSLVFFFFGTWKKEDIAK
jgi:ABC-2 type transport system permease protein